MSRREVYENIKEVLLKDDNIWEVETDCNNKLIMVIPNKNKCFLLVTDVLKSFRKENIIEICQRHFVLCNYDLDFDNWMLEIKEVG